MIERVTPEQISTLQPGQIFVFGSNQYGHHAGGAARYALDHFGKNIYICAVKINGLSRCL